MQAEQKKTPQKRVFAGGLSLGGSGGASRAIFGRCGSLYFLDRLVSTNFCEGLNGLSFRWTQPYQQQGRRIPSLSSEHTRSTCSRRFSGCLTEKTQQIHSLRASGVISSHAVSALESAAKALRKSAGRSCATPPGIFLVIRKLYTGASAMALNQKHLDPPPVFSWDKGLGCRPAKTLSQCSFGQSLFQCLRSSRRLGYTRTFWDTRNSGRQTRRKEAVFLESIHGLQPVQGARGQARMSAVQVSNFSSTVGLGN